MSKESYVKLNLEEYNLLRDFYNEIQKNNTVYLSTYFGEPYACFTVDEPLLEIQKLNEKLLKEVERLKGIIKELTATKNKRELVKIKKTWYEKIKQI